MPEITNKRKPPTGFSRLVWRVPIWFYRFKLGGLLGKRFLLLHHTGRVSGEPRENVLEIVNRDEAQNIYFVASGFGKKSDWFKNIKKQPEVAITVGNKKIDVQARILPPEESGQAMVSYARRHPKAAKNLMGICGLEVDGSDRDYFIVGRDFVPFVAFVP
jgi:deazaflavin-dependent oxidoreductase (nitroreductase family)